MTQPMGESQGDDVDIYFGEFRPEDLLSRTSDFLHRHGPHGPHGATDPRDLPDGMANEIMHISEHLLRYIGIIPEQMPFATAHGPHCNDQYEPYVDIRAELTKMGIDPDGPPDQVVALAEEALRRLNEDKEQ